MGIQGPGMSTAYGFSKDTIIRKESLYDILNKFGVPRKSIKLFKTYLDDTQS